MIEQPGVSLIVPAYNEGKRIMGVLEVVAACDLFAEVCVVNDGSTDDTSEQARHFPGVTVLDLPQNLGKGGAMLCGAMWSAQPVVAFLDADLVGLQPHHIESLLLPVADGQADMSIALFRGGRFTTDFSHAIASWVTGQRAIRRDLILSMPQIASVRSGVETLITRQSLRQSWRVAKVNWQGVTHVMQEEKLGALPGLLSRFRMYTDIAHTLLNGAPTERTQTDVETLASWVDDTRQPAPSS